MKKLILSLLLMLVVPMVFALTPTKQNEKAILFLSTRTIKYNIGVTPIQVKDIRAELKAIQKTNINYMHSVHSFYGSEINANLWMGLSCMCRDGGIAKPFIRYQVYTIDGITYLDVLFGSASW
jgi:hypothetical protein